MNEGRWIIITSAETGRKVAYNLDHVAAVYENHPTDVSNGKRATIRLSDGARTMTIESFDEIGAMIR